TLVRAIRAIGEPRDGRLSSVRQCVVHEGVHRSFPRSTQCARSRASCECSAWRKCGQQFPDSLANVGVLFPGLAATPLPDRAEAHARAEERAKLFADGKRTHGSMRSQVGAINRIVRVSLALVWAIEGNRPYLISIVAMTSC